MKNADHSVLPTTNRKNNIFSLNTLQYTVTLSEIGICSYLYE